MFQSWRNAVGDGADVIGNEKPEPVPDDKQSTLNELETCPSSETGEAQAMRARQPTMLLAVIPAAVAGHDLAELINLLFCRH
jgi:hypothetical protein